MRAWFFQALATAGGVRDWSAIDHTLAVAQSHGTKVIVTLGNQWQDCDGLNGGAGSFKDEAWYTGGYTQPDPAGTVSYRDWVAEIVERYKNDSTILAWQLMNEAEVKPSEGSGSCSANAAQILKSFADDVSGLVKSIDPNHLVSLGTIGGGQCGAQDEEYESVHDLSTIDLCEFHDYGSPNVPIPGDQWNGLQVRIDQCNALDKPLFVGETGIRQEEVASLNARANAFRAKFGAQFAAGIVGELVWAWNKDGSPGSYDIGPGDPTLGVLDEFKDGPFAVTYGPVLPRATADRPDDVTGPQIHVMYVLPSDGTDRELDTDGTLKNTVESFQTWLAGKTGGRPLRADTFQGSLDITFFQLSRTDEEIASFGAFVRDEIEDETQARGSTSRTRSTLSTTTGRVRFRVAVAPGRQPSSATSRPCTSTACPMTQCRAPRTLSPGPAGRRRTWSSGCCTRSCTRWASSPPVRRTIGERVTSRTTPTT